MKVSTLLIMVLAIFLSSAERCSSREDVSPEKTTATGCFSDAPLEKINWVKGQLAYFQRPKSGPLRVVVYSYKNEPFLAFENGFVSSPMSYIFDCSGATITKRGINYNAFYGEAKPVKVLLEGQY